MKFDEAILKESLAILAALHKVDWSWDGSHYPKPVRCCRCPQCSTKCTMDVDTAAEDDVQIPSPAKGGQKQISSTSHPLVKKRPAATKCKQDEQDKQGKQGKKFKLVHRVKEEKAYIMGDSYIVGLGKKRSNSYVEILKQCTELLENGMLPNKDSAKAWVDKVAAGGFEEQYER